MCAPKLDVIDLGLLTFFTDKSFNDNAFRQSANVKKKIGCVYFRRKSIHH
jgi:hypothetical protein